VFDGFLLERRRVLLGPEGLFMPKPILGLLLWGTAGFIISLDWGMYFAHADKSLPIGTSVYALAYATQPLAVAVAEHLRRIRGVSLGSVAVMNAVTYAVFGLILEMVRRKVTTLFQPRQLRP
jgi:hypothetical protein